MPELPEVETVRRGLEPLIVGRTIEAVRLNRADLRFALPDGLSARLAERRISGLTRRAKYLRIHTHRAHEDELVLVVHLGMSGRFFVAKSDHVPDKHDHVIIDLKGGEEIVFNDARRFGSMDLVEAGALESYKAFAGLGPEPLGNEFSGGVLFDALSKRKTSLKAALMDQGVVAGLGNIYVCEGLYDAKLNPRRLSSSIKPVEAERLARSIRDVLNAALDSGGSSLRDYVNANGEAGYFQHKFNVYAHEGAPCPRNPKHVIERIVQGGRSTFFCPACQK